MTTFPGLLDSLNRIVDDGRVPREEITLLCDAAAEKVTTVPALKAVLLLGAFNAARRVPGADLPKLIMRGHELLSDLAAGGLTSELALQYYHMGVLYHTYGNFEAAITAQATAAELYHALHDHPREMISLFLVEVEQASSRMAKEIEFELIEVMLQEVDAVANATIESLANSRWLINVPLHRLLLHVWADQLDYVDFASDLLLVRKLDTSGTWSGFIDAIEAYHYHSSNTDALLVAAEESGVAHTDIWLTVRLVRARQAGPDASELYQAVIDSGLSGGHVQRAFARRESGPLTGF